MAIASFIPLAAAASGDKPDTVGVVVIGFLFVVVVLALLAAVTATIGAFFSYQASREATKAARSAEEAAAKNLPAGNAPASAAEAPGGSVEDDPRMLAVVTAAVHTVFAERPHRVISVGPSRAGGAREGRRQTFASRRVR